MKSNTECHSKYQWRPEVDEGTDSWTMTGEFIFITIVLEEHVRTSFPFHLNSVMPYVKQGHTSKTSRNSTSGVQSTMTTRAISMAVEGSDIEMSSHTVAVHERSRLRMANRERERASLVLPERSVAPSLVMPQTRQFSQFGVGAPNILLQLENREMARFSRTSEEEAEARKLAMENQVFHQAALGSY